MRFSTLLAWATKRSETERAAGEAAWNIIDVLLNRKLVPDGVSPIGPGEAAGAQPESGKDASMDFPTGDVVFRVEGTLFRVRNLNYSKLYTCPNLRLDCFRSLNPSFGSTAMDSPPCLT